MFSPPRRGRPAHQRRFASRRHRRPPPPMMNSTFGCRACRRPRRWPVMSRTQFCREALPFSGTPSALEMVAYLSEQVRQGCSAPACERRAHRPPDLFKASAGPAEAVARMRSGLQRQHAFRSELAEIADIGSLWFRSGSRSGVTPGQTPLLAQTDRRSP